MKRKRQLALKEPEIIEPYDLKEMLAPVKGIFEQASEALTTMSSENDEIMQSARDEITLLRAILTELKEIKGLLIK